MSLSVLPTSTPPVPLANNAANNDPAQAQDRFLKLLVAQLSNQDPMNPMDNAQMTSQMAQINTVTGIQQLNQTMKDMAQQFSTLQALQGVSLVGHEVLSPGNSLSFKGTTGQGAMLLSGPADQVKVEILNQASVVVDSFYLGPKNAGQVLFDWPSSAATAQQDLRFRITAMQGNQAVSVTPLARDRVLAVGTENGAMTLELAGQKSVAYSAIKAIL